MTTETTIKAWTNANKLIEWSYDDPADAKALWVAILKTGRAPDTGDRLSRAYLWGPARKRSEGPDQAWAA